MKKKLYRKPSSNVIHLNIKDQLLDNKMGNTSPGAHVGDGHSGGEQAAKRYTLTDEEEDWDTSSKSNSPWDD
ncbi:MAG: hypothetical protein SO359_09200 [Prevotella sp.]|nr:hypothetical protein [Prevotella sp.]